METAAHRSLKVLAARWLRGAGCAAAGLEVRCPISRYRVDAAGYFDAPPSQPRAQRPGWVGEGTAGASVRLGATVFIECKASRADFLRDTADRARLLADRARLERELDRIVAEFVKPGEPELRESGTFLFEELEAWSLERARSPAYRAVTRALRRVDSALYGQTKFFMLAHYRLADRLWVLAPAGVVGAGELPRGWGLLEARGEGPADVQSRVEARDLGSPERRRLRVLRNIAAAGSWAAWPEKSRPTGTGGEDRAEGSGSGPIEGM